MTGLRRIGVRNLRRALIANRGNMAAAARSLGLARSTVYERVHNSAELMRVCEEIAESAKDDWENQLDTLAMNQGNVTACLALLNARARERGYGYSRSDIRVTGEIEHRHNLFMGADRLRALQSLDDQQLADLIAERRARLAAEDSAPRMIEINPTKTES